MGWACRVPACDSRVPNSNLAGSTSHNRLSSWSRRQVAGLWTLRSANFATAMRVDGVGGNLSTQFKHLI